MTEHSQSQGHGPSEVELHFKHVNEVETANFKMPETATLVAAWDMAYLKMDIARGEKDTLQTAGGHPKAMASYLGFTLAALKDQKIVEAYNFEIVGPTGGA